MNGLRKLLWTTCALMVAGVAQPALADHDRGRDWDDDRGYRSRHEKRWEHRRVRHCREEVVIIRDCDRPRYRPVERRRPRCDDGWSIRVDLPNVVIVGGGY